MLSIRGVTKRFGTFTAAADLSLEVPAGAVHACLGRNGAGKAATMRKRTGLPDPEAGGAALKGTRSLSTIEGVSDTIAVMDRGRLIASGTAAAIMGERAPGSTFSALTANDGSGRVGAAGARGRP